jgi:iron complex transport system substrate-binding protein
MTVRSTREEREGVGGVQAIDAISGAILDCSIQLHRELGPGLLESVYEAVLAGRLAQSGYVVERQKPIPIQFDGMSFDAAFRIDLLVDQRVLVEIKSVERLSAAHTKQILTYLRLSKCPLGLLINFGGATLMEGFKRFLNDGK